MLEIVLKYNRSTDIGCWMLAAMQIRHCDYTFDDLKKALIILRGFGIV